MRIISDFKDYYDGVMSHGVDHDSIWIRKSKEIKKIHSRSYYIKKVLYHDEKVIWFCGKRYKAFHFHSEEREIDEYIYNIEQLDKLVDTRLKKKEQQFYYGSEPPKGPWYRRRRTQPEVDIYRKQFEYYFKQAEKVTLCDKIHIEHNSPVIVGNTVNGCLKDVQFFKVVDPYTAYQEIQMFMCKLKSPEKPIPKVSDEDMLEAKGFDPKWSFRKEPGKKKRKKNKK